MPIALGPFKFSPKGGCTAPTWPNTATLRSGFLGNYPIVDSSIFNRIPVAYPDIALDLDKDYGLQSCDVKNSGALFFGFMLDSVISGLWDYPASIQTWTLSTPHDISTASNVKTANLRALLSAESLSYTGSSSAFKVFDDGIHILLSLGGAKNYLFAMSTPWDIESLVFVSNIDAAIGAGAYVVHAINQDGTKLLIRHTASPYTWRSLTTTTAWDFSALTVASSSDVWNDNQFGSYLAGVPFRGDSVVSCDDTRFVGWDSVNAHEIYLWEWETPWDLSSVPVLAGTIAFDFTTIINGSLAAHPVYVFATDTDTLYVLVWHGQNTYVEYRMYTIDLTTV